MQRFSIFGALVLTSIVAAVLALSIPILTPIAILGLGLSALGVWDLVQPRHAILRNYPVIGHMRWLFEGIRPEIRQYLIESDRDEVPFSREVRSLVYQRAKGVEDKRPFGTREDVYEAGYSWLTHSIAARHVQDCDFRVRVGGADCVKPYDVSLYKHFGYEFWGAKRQRHPSAQQRGAKGRLCARHRRGRDQLPSPGRRWRPHLRDWHRLFRLSRFTRSVQRCSLCGPGLPRSG